MASSSSKEDTVEVSFGIVFTWSNGSYTVAVVLLSNSMHYCCLVTGP